MALVTEGGLQPHRGGMDRVGSYPCLSPSVPQFPAAMSGGNTEWGSCGWLEGQCPCWVHQTLVNPTLLWQAASWIIPLLQELARDIPWRAVGEQLPARAFGSRGGSDSREGSCGTSSAARSEHIPGFALLSRSPSDAFPRFLLELCPGSPPGWVWAGQGAGAAARRAAGADLPSPLTFMPISISSAACPRPGLGWEAGLLFPGVLWGLSRASGRWGCAGMDNSRTLAC